MPSADKVFWFVVFMILGWMLWLKFVKPFGEIYEWLYLIVGPTISFLIVRTINNLGKKKNLKRVDDEKFIEK
ncbi:MAG: hypothetical protein QXQ66_09540 [Candidatus Hadarchaeum sp.]|uniref:hypothetical protein n=1 Tax=Candidatus Hadarchaeum sp. TaxID=2883567 RepID=UPI003169C9A6